MKVLVFDVFGKYALFRRSYTTTSSTSYDFPPRTAICGLIGAVLGIKNSTSDSSKYLRYFDSTRISVRLLKPIRKVNMAVNYIETKSGKDTRTQIILELIKDPAYRIYISEFSMLEELERCLLEGSCFFTPYLGQAQMIAKLDLVGSYEAQEILPPVEVHSVIKQIQGMKLEPQSGLIIVKERMTLNMDNERRPTAFATYWVERNTKPLKLVQYSEKVYRIEELNENICWMD
ncbi:MAG: type I-B CRISPR-associated protein Cas5b [Pseudothermotoga sp.]|nr:type I-B CRISPR-associated protein Cas5b [Pseudothermotoga sp.]